MEKPPPKGIMQKSNRGFWEKMSLPDFKNFFLWKKKRQMEVKLKYIIKHANVSRLSKEYMFNGYWLALFSRNLMLSHICNTKFSSSHFKKN